MAIRGWKKVKNTPSNELWKHVKNRDQLVSIYPNRYNNKVNYTLFVRRFEPQYTEDDISGKTFFSRSYKTREGARKAAMKLMLSNPSGLKMPVKKKAPTKKISAATMNRYKGMIRSAWKTWDAVGKKNGWSMKGQGVTVWVKGGKKVNSLYNKKKSKYSYIVSAITEDIIVRIPTSVVWKKSPARRKTRTRRKR